MKLGKFSIPEFPKFAKFPKIRLPFAKGGMKLSPLQHKREVLVVEVGDVWMKMAAAREGKIVAFDAAMVEGISDLDISQKIAAFARKETTKPEEVIISHPSHNLTTRVLSLPSVDVKEIKDIVDLQAVKQTPYSRDEITTGFRIIDQDSAGYSRVLVAISHREVAGRYFKLNELAGFAQSRMTASAEGTRYWINTLIQKGKLSKDEGILVLDVDWMTTDLLVFQKGEIVFSRSFGLGAKNLREQGAVIEAEFVREVQRSMESLASETKDTTISRIVVTGAQKPLKDFSAALVRELNLPCESHSVLEDLSCANPAQMMELEKEYAVSLSSIAAMASDPQAILLDLTPQEIQVRRNLEHRAKDLAMMGTLFLALISMVSLISVEKMYKRSGYLNSLRTQYRSLQGEAENVERLVAKMKLAHDQAGSSNSGLDVLRSINEVIPENIILTGFQYNQADQGVVIRGTSTEMSGVFQFLTTLENTPVLEQVKTRNVSKRKVDEKELAEFEIAARIHSGPDTGRPTVGGVVGIPSAGAPEIQGAK